MKKVIYIFLIFLAGQVLAGLIVTLLGQLLGGSWYANPCRQGYILLLANLLIVGALWKGGLAAQRSAWASLPYWGGRRLWVALLAMLLLALSQSLLTESLDLSDMGTQQMFQLMIHDPVCLLLLCVVGPLTEEIVFRDGILRQLVRWGLSPLWAVVVSALIFAMVHGNPQQAIPAFVLGIALGMLFAKTGDLRLCLPAHIFNNSLAVITMYIPGCDTLTEDWSLVAHIVPGAVLFAAGAFLIYRITYADRQH